MFEFLKKRIMKDSKKLDKMLSGLCRNEISIVISGKPENASPFISKFGGKPAVPADFIWPRFEAADYDGEVVNRPLSFLCQINLEEMQAYDKEKLLPKKGMLLFFYEMETMCWGYDPADNGCARVYYFPDVNGLAEMDLPEDLREDFRVEEFCLAFSAGDSYPSFEELYCHTDLDCDWEEYDETLTKLGCDMEIERHKLLGYADPVQGEMLTECERISRDMYCGNPESYQNTSEDEEASIMKAASDWILLFQMSSFEEDGYEIMFCDMGNIYFYIRKQDLKAHNFDRIHFSLQCG